MFETAADRLSDYRLGKAVRSGGVDKLSLAAGLLLDFALSVTGLSERDMKYGFNAYGKPYFTNCPEVRFSISHSGIYAMCAVSDAAVGVDVEKIRAGMEYEKIADRYFTEKEREYIRRANDGRRAFFELWTRKESFFKALGTGISGGMEKYDVTEPVVFADGRGFYFSKPFVCGGACASCCSEARFDADIEFVTAERMLAAR